MSPQEYDDLLRFVRAKLEGMSNEQRERFFKDVHDDYCTGCGTDNLPCHCQNDE